MKSNNYFFYLKYSIPLFIFVVGFLIRLSSFGKKRSINNKRFDFNSMIGMNYIGNMIMALSSYVLTITMDIEKSIYLSIYVSIIIFGMYIFHLKDVLSQYNIEFNYRHMIDLFSMYSIFFKKDSYFRVTIYIILSILIEGLLFFLVDFL